MMGPEKSRAVETLASGGAWFEGWEAERGGDMATILAPSAKRYGGATCGIAFRPFAGQSVLLVCRPEASAVPGSSLGRAFGRGRIIPYPQRLGYKPAMPCPLGR